MALLAAFQEKWHLIFNSLIFAISIVVAPIQIFEFVFVMFIGDLF